MKIEGHDGICGKPLVKNHRGYKNQREHNGKLKCFNHIGQEANNAQINRKSG